jgi:hypothetical protein
MADKARLQERQMAKVCFAVCGNIEPDSPLPRQSSQRVQAVLRPRGQYDFVCLGRGCFGKGVLRCLACARVCEPPPLRHQILHWVVISAALVDGCSVGQGNVVIDAETHCERISPDSPISPEALVPTAKAKGPIPSHAFQVLPTL